LDGKDGTLTRQPHTRELEPLSSHHRLFEAMRDVDTTTAWCIKTVKIKNQGRNYPDSGVPLKMFDEER